jgi:hypothetical protein
MKLNELLVLTEGQLKEQRDIDYNPDKGKLV